jgi:hypothetical protein
MVCANLVESEIHTLTSSGARSILWRQEAKEEVVKGKGYADTITTTILISQASTSRRS